MDLEKRFSQEEEERHHKKSGSHGAIENHEQVPLEKHDSLAETGFRTGSGHFIPFSELPSPNGEYFVDVVIYYSTDGPCYTGVIAVRSSTFPGFAQAIAETWEKVFFTP